MIIAEVSEAFFAAIVRALILVARNVIPGLDEKWKNAWKWKQPIIFGLSFLVVPMAAWLLRCPGGVNIPGWTPRCTFEGVILDCLYPGFLAYVLNYAGEEGFRWLERKARSGRFRTLYAILHWFGSLPFYLFLGTMALEFLLLVSGVGPVLSGIVSIIAAVVTTILTMLIPTLLVSFAKRNRIRGFGDTLWLIFMVVKIVVHFLPIPGIVKPAISIALTILLYLIINVIHGSMCYGIYKERL